MQGSKVGQVFSSAITSFQWAFTSNLRQALNVQRPRGEDEDAQGEDEDRKNNNLTDSRHLVKLQQLDSRTKFESTRGEGEEQRRRETDDDCLG